MAGAKKHAGRFAQAEDSKAYKSFDAKVSELAFQSMGALIPRRVLICLEHSGNGLIWIPGAAAASYAPDGDPGPVNVWAANLLLALLLDLLFVGLLKGLVRRPRPAYNDSSDFLMVATVDSFSFPSGHSSRASMVAGLVAAALLPEFPAAAGATAAWAAAVAASRVVLGRHFLTDVLGGLLLGTVVTFLATGGAWSTSGFHVGAEDLAALQARVDETVAVALGSLRGDSGSGQ